jgi:phosphatidate cytidylyltransferase
VLTQRVLSAAVLAPLAVAAVWFGSPWLPLVTALAGGVMAWEWARLCGAGGRVGPSGIVLIGAVLAAIATAGAGSTIAAALASSALGAAVVFAAARRVRDAADAGWLAVGVLWLGIPCALLLWLGAGGASGGGASASGSGRLTVLWIFAVVWATDIGAYAVGRSIGGARLAPRWSPGKTWSGLIGGILCAALAGFAAARLLHAPSALPLTLTSAGLAIVEQFGDLAESAAKRRFGVKDTSGLIPGHGGLLDRLDGLLAVIPAVALLCSLPGGAGAPLLAWR